MKRLYDEFPLINFNISGEDETLSASESYKIAGRQKKLTYFFLCFFILDI